MFLSLTEGNVIAALRAAPDKGLAYPELLKRFGNSRSQQKELLALLWGMRKDSECPLCFKDGWMTVGELVVYLKD